MSESTLLFPVQIAPEIGLNVNEINAFKENGCRFFGKKTSIKWVREHLERVTATESVAAPSARPQRSSGNKRGESRKKNG